jgi:hypothetical protein
MKVIANYKVLCNDGSYSVSNGAVAPCINSGGVKDNAEIGTASMPLTYAKIGSSVGFASGVIYAFSKKTGFWKGLGIAIIGNITLGGVGYAIDYAKYNKK